MLAARYCYRCFQFFSQDGEWDQHYEQHLGGLLLDYDVVIWREP